MIGDAEDHPILQYYIENLTLGDNACKQTGTIVAYHDQKEKSVSKNCHTAGVVYSSRCLPLGKENLVSLT